MRTETKQNILGVGFTRRTGLGYMMAVSYTQLGAEVVVGGSSKGSVEVSLRNLQRDKVDPNLLSSFAADLRDSTQIDQAIASLKEPPTIVIYASARGMEGFFLKMNTHLMQMRSIKAANEPDADTEIADKKAELREKLAIWLPESYQDALAVNRQAPEYLIARLIERFSEPFRFVYINSSFGYQGTGPLHYKNVYETKHYMSKWMTKNALNLATQGVDMHEEVDPVIFDTDVGESIMETICPFWSERVQCVINETKVSRNDVFASVRLFTDMTEADLKGKQKPNRHFLVTRAGVAEILDRLPQDLVMEKEEFDF